MAVALKELMEKFTNIDLVKLAGEKGMNHPVTWVHMVESAEIANFIEFGEMVFTTGIGLKKENSLYELVKKIQEKRASGIIVNIGPYITEVPQNVIDFCEEAELPLMIVPWKINMANIMRVMTYEITNKQLKDVDFEMAMKNAILYPQEEKIYLNPLKKQLFDIEANFVCILLQMEDKGQPLHEVKLNKINYMLKSKVGYRYTNAHITTIYNSIVIVVSESEANQIQQIIESCKAVLQTGTNKIEEVYYLVGEQVQGIDKLHISYESAGKLVCLIEYYRKKVDVIRYEEMGLLKLLLEIQNKEVVQKYYEETIKPIVKYDEFHGTDLLEVLEKYLEYNGSLKAVADDMFVHRNTVNYKLSKISTILERKLSSQIERTRLEVGIIIYYIFNKELY